MFRRVGLLFVQKEVSYYGDFGSKIRCRGLPSCKTLMMSSNHVRIKECHRIHKRNRTTTTTRWCLLYFFFQPRKLEEDVKFQPIVFEWLNHQLDMDTRDCLMSWEDKSKCLFRRRKHPAGCRTSAIHQHRCSVVHIEK